MPSGGWRAAAAESAAERVGTRQGRAPPTSPWVSSRPPSPSRSLKQPHAANVLLEFAHRAIDHARACEQASRERRRCTRAHTHARGTIDRSLAVTATRRHSPTSPPPPPATITTNRHLAWRGVTWAHGVDGGGTAVCACSLRLHWPHSHAHAHAHAHAHTHTHTHAHAHAHAHARTLGDARLLASASTAAANADQRAPTRRPPTSPATRLARGSSAMASQAVRRCDGATTVRRRCVALRACVTNSHTDTGSRLLCRRVAGCAPCCSHHADVAHSSGCGGASRRVCLRQCLERRGEAARLSNFGCKHLYVLAQPKKMKIYTVLLNWRHNQ
jgi:hypothetical protein